MSEEKLIKPEEYYYLAYKRTITIAEAWLKKFPKPEYKSNQSYNFDFDRKSDYVWYQGDKDGNDYFKRTSDGAIAIFTKYSHIKF